MATEIGTYVLPVMVSMRGIDAQVNRKMRDALRGVGDQAGADFTTAAAKKIGSSSSQDKMKVALAQSLRATGASETAGKEFADKTSIAIAKHLQSAQNQQRVASSLGFLQTHGDQAGRNFADKMATRLGIDLPNKTKAQRIGERIGQVIAAPIGLALRGGLLASAGVAATAVAGVGYVLTKGFQRLESIDSAKFKLKALGHDATEVQSIMDSALKSVKGTSFGLDEAATSAASAVAAGIKPGEQLTKYLKEIADTAAVAGTNFDDMGHIFNKVQTQNKAFTDDLNMLSDRGIPIFTWLQQEYGVTAEALSKMVESGEVDAAHFQHAIETHIGGAALTMGQSFDGSVKNVEAAIGRLGAAFLKPVFEGAPGGLGGLTEGLDKLTAWADQHQGDIAKVFGGIGTAIVDMVQIALKNFALFTRGLAQIVNAAGDTYGGMTRAIAAVNRALGRNEIADQLDHIADGAFGWADGMYKVADSLDGMIPKLDPLKDSISGWAGSVQNATGVASHLGDALNALPANKTVDVKVDLSQAEVKMQEFLGEWKKQIVLPVTVAPGATPPGYNPLLPAGPASPAAPAPPFTWGRHASGGSIFGPGTGTSDSVPIMASRGEHMWTAREVDSVGGQSNMYRLRALARKGAFRHMAGGGGIKMAVPWGVDPHGGSGGGDAAGRFTPWWDMDWMPPEHPERLGPGDGRWWFRGPTGKDKMTPGGHWAPPIGKLRPPRPGDPYPGMIPDPEIKRWGFKDGGEITSDWFTSVVGTPYQMGGFGGGSFDCSGAVSGAVNVIMGRPWNKGPAGGSARMATGSEGDWLSSQGFVMGVGPPGSVRVGWVNGGPGGGHTAMTLPDGRNFESSSGKGVALGGNARGADDPMFSQHAYLPAGPQLDPKQGSPASQSPSGSGSSASSGSSRGGGGGGTNLSDMVGGAVKIGIDGLMETIGADGSFLPENLGIPKTLMAALGLKFNTPAGSFSLSEGFKPAASGLEGGASAGTSSAPFGMPSAATQLPQVGSPASGVGTGPAPGPVDQSTNIHINNPQGDPAEIEKRTRTALKTTPRVDTHMPAGF